MVFRGRFQVLGLATILAIFMSVDVVMAQPGRGGGSIFGQVTQLSLLGQQGVQKELELVEDQLELIEDIRNRQREGMRDLFMGARDRFQGMSDDERRKAFQDIQKKMQESNKELEAEALEELLPHQTSRLKQLLAQAQSSRNGGPTSGRLSEGLIEELGLTDKQIEELKEKAAEVSEKLKEKVAKLQAQAQEEIFSSVLSADQHAKYKELMGDAFEFEARGRGGFGGADRGGRGGGDRGGRGGGDRGGRGGGDRGSDF
jgi:hypothetical protein